MKGLSVYCVFPDASTLLQYRYSLSLILDDGTGSIEVNVDGKQSVGYYR